MRIIPRKLLFVPMLCVLSVFLLSFIFTLPSGAIGGGKIYFVQCEEKYKICREIENFLTKQHLATNTKFMIAATGSVGKIQYMDDRDVFVLLSESIGPCKKSDCMVLNIEKNDLKWQVNFSSPTNGTVIYVDSIIRPLKGRYIGAGYSIRSSFGYLFYEPIDGRYRLSLIYKEE